MRVDHETPSDLAEARVARVLELRIDTAEAVTRATALRVRARIAGAHAHELVLRSAVHCWRAARFADV